MGNFFYFLFMTVRRKAPAVLALAVLAAAGTWQCREALAADKPQAPVEAMLAETKTYILNTDTEPGYNSQWFALGLAREGMELDDPYFQTFYEDMAAYLAEQGGVLHRTKYTEYSKAILSLTAIGIDARDVGGYNLLASLADFTNVTRQGCNGPIWALIALNSNPAYDIPLVEGVQVQTTEQVLVDYLTGIELQGGGWTLMGDEPDVDITAMAIQSLAPYYGQEGREAVTDAVDRGLEVLSSLQQASTGGFQSWGTDNSESCAQVIVALCSLGIDPAMDERFLKGGNWTVGNLASYYVEGSGFMHTKPGTASNGGAEAGTVNGMATEQGFYALTAYQRLLEGKTSLYDMSDVELTPGPAVEPRSPSPTASPAQTATKTPDTSHPANQSTDPNGEIQATLEPTDSLGIAGTTPAAAADTPAAAGIATSSAGIATSSAGAATSSAGVAAAATTAALPATTTALPAAAAAKQANTGTSAQAGAPTATPAANASGIGNTPAATVAGTSPAASIALASPTPTPTGTVSGEDAGEDGDGWDFVGENYDLGNSEAFGGADAGIPEAEGNADALAEAGESQAPSLASSPQAVLAMGAAGGFLGAAAWEVGKILLRKIRERKHRANR